MKNLYIALLIGAGLVMTSCRKDNSVKPERVKATKVVMDDGDGGADSGGEDRPKPTY